MIGEQLAPVQGGLRNGTVYDYPMKASAVGADVGGHDKIEKVLTIVVTPRTVSGTVAYGRRRCGRHEEVVKP